MLKEPLQKLIMTTGLAEELNIWLLFLKLASRDFFTD
jgi:hypothetical protein